MTRRYEKGSLIWVSPGSIRYDRTDIELLLPYLKYLEQGLYPIDPNITGYVGGNTGRQLTPHAMACEIAAEINRRLAMTGTDREYVERHYKENWPAETIARHYNKTVDLIWERINLAIGYISSGKCSRWQLCDNCLNTGCYKRGRPVKTYGYWLRSWSGKEKVRV